jgi:NitT/TauT family transport system substrate-binding protein
MRKFLITSLANSLIAILFLTACQSNSNIESTHKKEITIAQFAHLLIYLPIYVAKDKGYFDDEGLKVNLVSTGGDEKTFTAVETNNAQFGVADPVFVAVARQQGRGGKVVASIVNGVCFWGIAFDPKIKSINKPEDLAGLRIATYSAPSTDYTVIKYYLGNHGHSVKANIVQGSATASLLSMIKTKQADIASDVEPIVSIAVQEGGHIVFNLQEEFGEFAFTGLTVSDNYCVNHGDEIQKVVNAIAKAQTFIYIDTAGAMAIAKKEFPELSQAVIEQSMKRMITSGVIPKSPLLSEKAWNNAIELRRKVGDITGDGSYGSNVDMTFAKNAVSKL